MIKTKAFGSWQASNDGLFHNPTKTALTLKAVIQRDERSLNTEISRKTNDTGSDFWSARKYIQEVYAATKKYEGIDLVESADIAKTFERSDHDAKGFVYVMKSGEFYKIGYAKNAKTRLVQLQTSTPHDLVLIHTIETDKMELLESMLHAEYRKKHVRGEWFRLEESDIERLKQM